MGKDMQESPGFHCSHLHHPWLSLLHPVPGDKCHSCQEHTFAVCPVRCALSSCLCLAVLSLPPCSASHTPHVLFDPTTPAAHSPPHCLGDRPLQHHRAYFEEGPICSPVRSVCPTRHIPAVPSPSVPDTLFSTLCPLQGHSSVLSHNSLSSST